MTLWQEYRRPTTITEALHDLNTAKKPAIPIAGGTDLLLDLKQGRHAAVHTLVDLTVIEELSVIEMRGDELFIGAATPISQIINNNLVEIHAQALVESCNLIAGPQVRNTATLGGNIAHALPAAEGTIALIALDAQVEIANLCGVSRRPLISIYKGPGKTDIDNESELITGFYTSAIKTRQASAFSRIMRPQGVALPILNCAIWLERINDLNSDIHIAVGPGGPTPFRATSAEEVMRGEPYNDQIMEKMFQVLIDQAKFRSSAQRASSQYRYHIVRGLVKKTYEKAWQRAV